MKSEFLVVAENVLQITKRSMTPRQIVDFAIDNRMFSDRVVGKTPHQTMNSKLSVHARREGAVSTFVRTKKGHFFLRRLIEDANAIYNATPLRMPPQKEKCLVFPATWLDTFGRFQGVSVAWKRLTKELLTPSVCRYLSRLEAEGTDEYKQILTYVLVTRGQQVLAYERGNYNHVEEFLRGSQCIGFGGHVIENDRNLFSDSLGVLDGAARELKEELNLPDADVARLSRLEGLEIIGLLNDDSSPVGRRHLAVLMRYEVSEDPKWAKPTKGEKSISQVRWLDPSAPDFTLWDFEYWSQLCLRAYFPALVKTQPKYIVRRKAPFKIPHLLCVLGEIGSGKSEATRILKEEFGYLEINSGQVLSELLHLPAVPATPRTAFQAAAWAFITAPDGPSRLAQALWSRVEMQKFPRLLIDGIRQQETLQELLRLAGRRRVAILYVYTPPDIAYEFYRGRADEVTSIHDFLAIRDSPVEREVRNLIGRSDAVIYNWTGRLPYRNTLAMLMGEAGHAP